MVELTYGAQTVQLVVYAERSLDLGTGGYGVLLTALGVPVGVTPIGAVALGHRAVGDRPSGSGAVRTRRPLDDVVHAGRW